MLHRDAMQQTVPFHVIRFMKLSSCYERFGLRCHQVPPKSSLHFPTVLP